MRKSTLLMGLLLGCATASAEYVVPVASTADAPKYYKVVANRALTLQYANAINPDGSTASQNTAVEAGQGTFGERPYVGLYQLNNAAISTDAAYVPNASLFWRFDAVESNTSGKLDDGVRWVNLYKDDMVLYAGGGQSELAHLTKDGATLYAVNLNYVNEVAGTQLYTENSYAISWKGNDPNKGGCFDVKNYCGVAQSFDVAPYVFMAADWNPFSDFGVDPTTGTYTADPNLNNGSVFYFEEATDEEVANAKVELAAYEKKLLGELGPELIDNALKAGADRVLAYANVPALWKADVVNAVADKIDALTLDINDYDKISELYEGIEAYNKSVSECLAGINDGLNNTIITLKNVSRPYLGEEGKPAYLAANVKTEYNDNYEPIEIKCLDVADNADDDIAKWTIQLVDGQIRLINNALDCYASNEELAVNKTWLTTTDKSKAALFTIAGAATDTLPDATNRVYVRATNLANGADYAYSCIHAAGSGTNYNVVGYTAEATMDGASTWEVANLGENSAIESIAVDKTNLENTIFDINGRRISKINRSGLYIVNGKKVIVRK
ncbi:MAG: hypothetical protein K2L32_08550 [Muribaculaceae bacterium]|nr:hypothetical protein [Muribaculaceae bacterium]